MRAKVTLKDWAPAMITAKFEKQAMDGLEKACDQIASAARSLCPTGEPRQMYKGGAAWTERVPGTLRNSIRVRRLSGDPFLNVRVYAGARQHDFLTAYYAHMVEFGTAKMRKRPFLRPALDSVKGNIISIITNEGGS